MVWTPLGLWVQPIYPSERDRKLQIEVSLKSLCSDHTVESLSVHLPRPDQTCSPVEMERSIHADGAELLRVLPCHEEVPRTRYSAASKHRLRNQVFRRCSYLYRLLDLGQNLYAQADRPGFQPCLSLMRLLSQADGLGWDEGAPLALVEAFALSQQRWPCVCRMSNTDLSKPISWMEC
jgi:hypothetical protein